MGVDPMENGAPLVSLGNGETQVMMDPWEIRALLVTRCVKVAEVSCEPCYCARCGLKTSLLEMNA